LTGSLFEIGDWVQARLASRLRTARFRRFEGRIHPETWENRDRVVAEVQDFTRILGGAGRGSKANPQPSIVVRGLELREKVLAEFRDRCKHLSHLRVAVHIPPKEISAGGHSVFSNLASSLEYLGLQVGRWPWKGDTESFL